MSDNYSGPNKFLEIDFKKGKKLGIVYPNREVHPALAKDVQTTKDGKYVLNYIDFYKYKIVPSYTEITLIDGEWAKHPFHKKYDEYEFNEFDKELSDNILEQLPKYLYFRIYIKPDNKSYDILPDEKDNEKLENVTVTEDVYDIPNLFIDKETLLYMVLISNDGESVINKRMDGGEYNFDIPFPVFNLPYEVVHESNMSDSSVDINSEVTFTQNEYSRGEIPMTVRRAVSDFLKNNTSDSFDIRDLPIFEYVDEIGYRFVICFVSCSDIKTYNAVYKAESLRSDVDMPRSSSYDNDLESALHDEIPLSISLANGDIEYNDVKHSSLAVHK